MVVRESGVVSKLSKALEMTTYALVFLYTRAPWCAQDQTTRRGEEAGGGREEWGGGVLDGVERREGVGDGREEGGGAKRQ